MKKIFTLLFATAVLSTAFAQHGQKGQRDRDDDRDDYAYNDKHDFDKRGRGHHGGYVFTPRERDMQIAQIYHEFDYRINRVRHQSFVSWYQKKHQINHLEEERSHEIQDVWLQFNDRKNKFGDNRHGKRGRW